MESLDQDSIPVLFPLNEQEYEQLYEQYKQSYAILVNSGRNIIGVLEKLNFTIFVLLDSEVKQLNKCEIYFIRDIMKSLTYTILQRKDRGWTDTGKDNRLFRESVGTNHKIYKQSLEWSHWYFILFIHKFPAFF